MMDGQFSPARLDGLTLPSRNEQAWESTVGHGAAPEVAYSLQMQCEDDYFLSVKTSRKSLLARMLPVALQQGVEKLIHRVHGAQR